MTCFRDVPVRPHLRLRLLARLGFAASLGGFASCLQEDDFVDDFAAQVCRLAVDCNTALTLPGESEPLPNDRAACESAVVEHYSVCSDGCEMSRRHARRCLRRIEDTSCPDGSGTDLVVPLACDLVFRSCDPDVVEQGHCVGPTCSVVPQRDAPLGGLALLGVGLWARRRRLRSR
jgi:hypothetical protein